MAFAEEKWNLRILSAILWKPMGFNQLCRFLKGISPNTLAKRLDRLEALGLVDRAVISTTPPATQYSATPAARELRPVLEGLAGWGATHIATAEPNALSDRSPVAPTCLRVGWVQPSHGTRHR